MRAQESAADKIEGSPICATHSKTMVAVATAKIVRCGSPSNGPSAGASRSTRGSNRTGQQRTATTVDGNPERRTTGDAGEDVL
jgi:hypothetical protein